MTTATAQAYLLEHRELLEDAGFVAVVYAGRSTVSFMKSVTSDQEIAKVLQGREEIPQNLLDIMDAEEEFSLIHPEDQPQPERDRNFIVIQISADGMVKRMNGVGGHIEGPFALGTAPARTLLQSVGATLPLMEEELVALAAKAVVAPVPALA